MQKEQLCREIGRRLGLPAKDIRPVIEVFMATVGRSLARKESVQLRGFGTFSTVQRAGRRVKPPRSKTFMQVPGKMVPAFRPHKELIHFIRAFNR